jgi:O-antigen/teichoic acid export membrane protein
MPHFHPEQVKPLFSFGGWVSVSGLMAPLLTAIDRLIIGALAGLAAVTHYTIPYNLSSRLTIFSASYSSALFPRMAMDGKDGNKRQLIKRMKIISALIAPVFVLAAYAVEPFFTYWIDAEFSANASPIALLLVLGFLFNSMAILMFNYLQACGRPDLIAKSQLIQLPIYLMLLYVLLEQMGVIGAALATALRMFMGFSFLVVIVRLVQQAVTVTWLPVLLVAVAVSINYFGLFDRFVLVAVGAVHLAISLVAACVANKEVLCVRLFSQ